MPFLEAAFCAIAAKTWEYIRLKQAVVYSERVDTCLCEPNLMRAFIPEPAELELIPDATEASEAAADCLGHWPG